MGLGWITGRRLGVLALLAVPPALLATCATHVRPPAAPSDPVSVYIVDYGRHASLLVPAADGDGLVEWAYGEWRWYALDDSAWYRVFPVLLWPTRGTLGRHHLAGTPSDRATLADRLPSEAVHEIVVDGRRANELDVRLQTAWAAALDTRTYQGLHGLDFVHDDASYHLFHTSNHAVAGWLTELGCQVTGPSILSDWELVPH
jgi:hypothetical protein